MPSPFKIPLLAAVLASTAFGAARYPFPRNLDYPHGIRASVATASGQEVQSAYEAWLGNFYHEQDTLAGVNGGGNTSSSELAYGMLAMVYMDNASNNTQSKFDRLLAFHDAWPDSNALMNWRIEGFASVVGKYSATDAELDAALALLLAYRQWDEPRYLSRAKDLIGRIYRYEVDSTGILKPGDGWDPYTNPSYLSFVAFHLFAQVDTNDWAAVLRDSYALLSANTSAKNSSSGLPSDWCSRDGTPVKGKRSYIGFDYDAIRVPWRTGLAWSWFGDSGAKKVDSAIAAFALSPNYEIQGRPDSISSGYNLNGTRSFYQHSSYPFLGAFACAGMVDSSFHAWVDTGYPRLVKWKTTTDVYIGSLNLLELLYLSGNFNDFWGMEATTGILPADRRSSVPRVRFDGARILVQVPGSDLTSVSLWTAQGRRLGNSASVLAPDTWSLSARDLAPGVYYAHWTAPIGSGTAAVSLGLK